MINMKTTPLQCSIVIRAFNEGKYISRLLEGIRQQTLHGVQVILVDSGSSDDTLKIATGFGAEIVTIAPEEFTFGRALNRGIQAARADIIVIVSAHCHPVFPDWLEQLLKPFQDEHVALSYGKQRGGETNPYSEKQFFRKYFPETSQPYQGQPYSHNANTAIRKKLWQMQPFNEHLTGLEDLSWSSWAMSQDYAIAYTAEAEVIHVHDERPRQVYKRFQREAIAMKQILPDSHFNLWNFFRLAVGSTLSDLLQARREGVLSKNITGIIWYRLVQYWGTYCGYASAGKMDVRLQYTFYYPPGILADKISRQRPVKPIDYAKKDG